MVGRPRDYLWSGYPANAERKADPLLSPHGLYSSLARDEGERRAVYREVVKARLDAQLLDEIRDCTNKGWALGCRQFQSRIERVAARRATPLPKGRPKRADAV